MRFVAATNSPLEHAIKTGAFRDLYYRLCVFAINLPPLRNRPEDILTLAHHFLREHAPSRCATPRTRRERAARARQLSVARQRPGAENTIIRAIHLRKAAFVSASNLGLSIEAAIAGPQAGRTFHALKQETIATFERRYLERVMHEHHGNVTHAAQATGKERRELGRLLKKHRIDPQSFRRLSISFHKAYVPSTNRLIINHPAGCRITHSLKCRLLAGYGRNESATHKMPGANAPGS